ncbi:MAG: caspase family protein, partial [Burkholderiaceae bacterium]|nr:caspase family protein [Burkholderiaceae bacterium]
MTRARRPALPPPLTHAAEPGLAAGRERADGTRAAASTGGSTVERWALLVGISRYASDSLNLRFSARDAAHLRDVLQQPTAGAFAPDHVLTLLDAEATLAGMNRALRTFLKRPAADDLVLVFFACHGAHDPERPGNLYLLPHDTDPDDVSGTALPMREVDLALRETLHARRVVVLMDTCHSGGVATAGPGRRARSAAADDLNQYLNRLSQAREGVSLMTSAMANEASLESEAWGQGHGVFTHFVLEGLRGKADREPQTGVITVGKLFDYVTEQVQHATGGQQHPHIGAAADRDLPLAVLSASTAGQHLALARQLADAALWLGEPVCWLAAATQLQRAVQLQAGLADAPLVHRAALALALAGERDAAAATWAALPPEALVAADAAQAGAAAVAPETATGTAPVPARAWQGLVALAQGRTDAALPLLTQPTPAAPWVPALLASRPTRARRVALLVGLNKVDPAHFGGWDGALVSPEQEAQAFGAHLQQAFGFEQLETLLGPQATLAALREVLGRLLAQSTGLESLVVLLSGHGGEMPDSKAPLGREVTFVAFDGQLRGSELARLLGRSHAAHTTLVASFAHSGHMVPLARHHGFDVLAACADNQSDQEGPRYSFFMDLLLAHLRPGVSASALTDALAVGMRKRARLSQVPQLLLSAQLPPLLAGAAEAASAAGVDLARTLLGGAVAAEEAVLVQALALAADAPMPGAVLASLMVAAIDRLGAPRAAGALGPALERLGAHPGGDMPAPWWAAVVQAAVRLASPLLPWQALAGLAAALEAAGQVQGGGLAAVAALVARSAALPVPTAARRSVARGAAASAGRRARPTASPGGAGATATAAFGPGPGARVLLVGQAQRGRGRRGRRG